MSTDLRLQPPHPWLLTQWQQLLNSIAQQRVGHAWLLTGSPGMGQLDLAKQFAEALICQQRLETFEACGHCKHCKLLAVGNYPDLILVQPEAQTIKVDQIRELITSVSATPTLASTRVVIIEPAEALHRSAANALLKTLEEPTPQTVLILVSYQPHLLPATLVSRCRRMHCVAAETEDSEAGTLALALSDGAPLAAATLLESEHWAMREKFLKLLWDVSQQKCAAVDVATQLANIAVRDLMIWLYYVIVDLIRIQQGLSQQIIQRDSAVQLQKLAAKCEIRQLHNFLEILLVCLQQMQAGFNLNNVLLCDYIMVQWQHMAVRETQ